MDGYLLCRRFEDGRGCIREGDPHAYVAIGGGQMPGWGGYDYARITKALTAIEPYDIGRNVDIIHSLNPAMPILSTGFAAGPRRSIGSGMNCCMAIAG